MEEVITISAVPSEVWCTFPEDRLRAALKVAIEGMAGWRLPEPRSLFLDDLAKHAAKELSYRVQ